MRVTRPCPKCGALLVERVNRETREPFYGCERYPDCTYTENLPESVKLRRQGQKGMFDDHEASD